MSAPSIRTLVTTLFSLLLTLAIIAGAFSTWTFIRVDAASKRNAQLSTATANATDALVAGLVAVAASQTSKSPSRDGDFSASEAAVLKALSDIERAATTFADELGQEEGEAFAEQVKSASAAYLKLHAQELSLLKSGASVPLGLQDERATALKALVETATPSKMGRMALTRAEDAKSALATEMATIIGFIAVVALFGITGGWSFFYKRVLSPLASLVETMTSMSRGDTSQKPSGLERGDEIGAMSVAVEVFRQNMIEADRLRKEQADAEMRNQERRKADMARVADQFRSAVSSVVDVVSQASQQIEGSAGSLLRTADSTKQLSALAASASQNTSSNVMGVATAAEQLSSTVAEIGQQVEQARKIASNAVSQAATTNTLVTALSDTADKIGSVVGLINSIASQTNLLALNATIEAARAGEAGKGFAVVAQEVKALAAQTANATRDIEGQISSMIGATEEAVTAIGDITVTINSISEISQAIAAAVEEQGATTQEIARNVAEASRGSSEIATMIGDVNRGAEKTGAASSEVLEAATKLSSQSAKLGREVETFLKTVSAA